VNKYQTGVYHLHLFDKHGSKQETRILHSLIAADKEGAVLIQKPPFASYAITRVLRNSIDEAYPWACSNPAVYDNGCDEQSTAA
jgi:hypothetical protein